MRLTIRAASAPAVERPGGSSSISIRSNSVLSIRAEAAEGSTLAIVSNTNVSIQMLLFKPILTRTVVTIAAGNRLQIQTGTQVVLTAAASGFGFNRDLVLAGQPDLANETLTDFVLIGQRITDPTIPERVASDTGDDIKFTTQASVDLRHNLVSYNNSFGEILYDLKIPSLPVRADFRHRVLYGDPSIGAPLSNPSATFSRAAAAWSWPDGQDFSGNGRHLTPGEGDQPAFPYDRPAGEPSFAGATVVTATTEAQFRSAILNQAAGTSLEVRVSDISIVQSLDKNWGTNRTRRLKIVAVNKVFTAYDPMTDTKTNHQPNRAIIRRRLLLHGYDALVFEGLEFRWGACLNNYRVNTVWVKHCDFISPPGEDGETMALSQVCDLYVLEQCRFESLDGTLGETEGGVSQDYAIRAYHETNVHFLGCRVTGLYHNPMAIKEDDTHSMFVRVDYCYFNGRDPNADYFDTNYCLLLGQTQDDSAKFDVTIPRVDVKRCKFNCGNGQWGIQVWNVGIVNVTDCEFIRGKWGIEINIDGQVYNPPRRVDPPIHPSLTYVKNCTWTNAPTTGNAIYLSTRSRGTAEVLRLENCSGPSGLLTIEKDNADQRIDRVGGNASGFAP